MVNFNLYSPQITRYMLEMIRIQSVSANEITVFFKSDQSDDTTKTDHTTLIPVSASMTAAAIKPQIET